jgi:hypothetical protein
MRTTSVYCVECLCGHHLESESKELVCPGCQRQIVIEWPAQEVKSDNISEAPVPAAT